MYIANCMFLILVIMKNTYSKISNTPKSIRLNWDSLNKTKSMRLSTSLIKGKLVNKDLKNSNSTSILIP